jgi:hypothetical protein
MTMEHVALLLLSIVKGPYLQNVSPHGVTVVWQTSSAEAGEVHYTSPGGSEQVASDGGGTLHKITLAGLTAGTRYSYFVRSAQSGASGAASLHTAPAGDEPFTFLVYGDDRDDDAAHAQVVGRMGTESADFILQTGDMTGDGRVDSNWVRFFQIEHDLLASNVMYPAIGNHEYDGILYAQHFAPPENGASGLLPPERTYWFQYGNSRFIALDTNNPTSSGQATWLTQLLAAARSDPSVRNIFVFYHECAYSNGTGHGDTAGVKQTLVPILEAGGGVTLVFQGHDHIYSRLRHGPNTYVVAGGGGAPLYGVDGTTEGMVQHTEAVHHYLRVRVSGGYVEATAVRADGTTIEQFTIGAPPGAVDAAADAPVVDAGVGGSSGGGGNGGTAGNGGSTGNGGAAGNPGQPREGGGCSVAASGGSLDLTGVGALALLAIGCALSGRLCTYSRLASRVATRTPARASTNA